MVMKEAQGVFIERPSEPFKFHFILPDTAMTTTNIKYEVGVVYASFHSGYWASATLFSAPTFQIEAPSCDGVIISYFAQWMNL